MSEYFAIKQEQTAKIKVIKIIFVSYLLLFTSLR